MSSDKMPPDWAIEKALAKFHEFHSAAYWSPEKIKTTCDRSQLGFCSMVIAHATLIAEHEEAPVDPLYEALFAVVSLGRYDTPEQTELLRHELKERGLQIVEVKPVNLSDLRALTERHNLDSVNVTLYAGEMFNCCVCWVADNGQRVCAIGLSDDPEQAFEEALAKKAATVAERAAV